MACNLTFTTSSFRSTYHDHKHEKYTAPKPLKDNNKCIDYKEDTNYYSNMTCHPLPIKT